MATKVLVEISGGVCTAVCSNQMIDLVVIDYDNLKEGDKVEDIEVSVPDNFPDRVTENMYELFDVEVDILNEVRERLKELNF